MVFFSLKTIACGSIKDQIGIKKEQPPTETQKTQAKGIYVYCAQTAVCDDTGADGSLEKPYQTISAALVAAQTGSGDVLVAARGGNTPYSESLTLFDGVSIYGGFDSSFYIEDRSTSANETLIEATTTQVILANAIVTNETIIDGFTVRNGTSNGLARTIYATESNHNLKIRNCTLIGASTDGSSFAIEVSDLSPVLAEGPVIEGNRIYSGRATNGTIASWGVDVFNSNVIIKNNQIFAGLGTPYGVGIRLVDSKAIVSNNTIAVSGQAFAYGIILYSLGGSQRPIITNNFLAIGGTEFVQRAAIYEEVSNADARSLENNVAWIQDQNANPSSVARFYTDFDNGCASADNCDVTQTQALTSWQGGADKARGNIQLPSGALGNSFVSFPDFIDGTSSSNTGSSSVLKVNSCSAYTAANYIEWNADGVARQIQSCVGNDLTISPPLDSPALNLISSEIRYWGSKSSGGSQYKIDVHLTQNSLATGTWQNVIYGGKNTNQSSCGASAGLAGLGIEECGMVSDDFEKKPRTTANANLATNDNDVNAPAAGFSIGAFEYN